MGYIEEGASLDPVIFETKHKLCGMVIIDEIMARTHDR